MLSVNLKNLNNTLEKQLPSLYSFMESNGDSKNASKIMDLYEKYQANEYTIGFSGHFSAGKSSMINYLLHEDILPRSPIPTSANIVKITSEMNGARIFFNNEDYIFYEAPYDMDLIKEYCKDKKTINKIELGSTHLRIPNYCSFFDTPGIDAADDTDRLITESSLHLIDHMIYVVDYNHIQSEVNLLFLEKLQKMDIPYDLVVNQVDKHNEHEITFKELKNKVKQTFDQWNLTPNHLYFTSLIDSNISINELAAFERYIYSKLDDKTYNFEANIEYILQEHIQFLSDNYYEEDSSLDLSEEAYQKNRKRLEEVNRLILDEKNKPNQVQRELNKAIELTLKNAYIMPARLRDVAQSFLESQEKHFKVGIINSKKKTEEEKKRRTEQFLSALTNSIDATLKWKIRDKLHEVIKRFDLENEEITEDIQHLTIHYTSEDLLRLINPGAKVNGDYLLNYTNDVSNDIKHKYKQQLNNIVSNIVQLTSKQNKQEIKKYETEYKQIEDSLASQDKVKNKQRILNNKLTELEYIIDSPSINTTDVKEMEEKIQLRYRLIDKMNKPQEMKTKNKVKPYEGVPDLNSTVSVENNHSIEAILSAIDATIETVEKMPEFQSMVDDLSNRKSRLTNQQFTIALFGAFSAGKSSFANALIKERLLPTSPNPTTAVINKIAPPNQDNKHRSIIIMFKDEATLLDDLYSIVKNVTNVNNIGQFDDYKSLLQWISKHDIQHDVYLDKTLQSFLQAMLNGLETNKANVNAQKQISMEQFESYVTDETVACYIESVTLYYDCSITKKGITLVDTPGADSINARHTNVAFDYIKHADLILYVTYYNHALSRADKNFLLQLGRVKDSFELDKLYFIINAIDLAENKQEVNLVRQYVESQLVELGIRFPKIYSLSSKTALDDIDCNQKNKEMKYFKDSLVHFIEYDLQEVIMQSTMTEIDRVKQTLNDYLHTAQLNGKEQANFKEKLLDTQAQARNVVVNLSSQAYNDRLKQRIDKQLYHVNERLSIRFHDMFKEKFNPTTVTESGRDAMEQLQYNMNELIDYVGYELLQEIRAVSLRIESFIRMLYSEVNKNVVEQIKEIETHFKLSTESQVSLDTPKFEQPLTHINHIEFKKALQLFKNTKSFFEKNEKEEMKEEIFNIVSPYIEDQLQSTNIYMFKSYNQQWQSITKERIQEIQVDIDTYVQNSLDIMTRPRDIKALKQKMTELEKITSTMYGENNR